jgi:hypothetical protein
MRKIKSAKLSILALLAFMPFTFVFGQAKKDGESFQKKAKITALVIGNYAVSLDKSIDINTGVHNNVTDSGVVTNSFNLKYIRIQGNFELTKKIDATVLVNFAELKNAKSDYRKVIELAYVRYKFFKDDYLNFQIGQFRPYNQVEDMYGIQFHKSNTWSNQYSAFGSSNWASFQLGAALTGSLKKKNVPLSYYLTVWNGNGRTVSTVSSDEQTNGDNDNYKNYALRLEYEPVKDLILGASASTAKYQGKPMNAYSADLRYKHNFDKKWGIELESAYADANDVKAIIAKTGTTIPASSINFGNYKMHGVYFIPVIKFFSPDKVVKTTEFSCRYEYWKQLVSDNNPRTTIVPMISLNFAENRGAVLQLYGVINKYKNQVTNAKSAIYNSNQIAIQAQFYF